MTLTEAIDNNRSIFLQNTPPIEVLQYIDEKLYQPNYKAVILAPTMARAQALLAELKNLRPGRLYVENNKRKFELENGSRVYAMVNGSDAIRGHAFSLVYVEDTVNTKHSVLNNFMSAVWPTVSAMNAKLILGRGETPLERIWKLSQLPVF